MAPEVPKDTLVIESESGVFLYQVRGLLAALETAYNYIYVEQMFLERPDYREWILQQIISKKTTRFGRMVEKDNRLILQFVQLESPGIWAFLGHQHVLEQIRLYLQERHERRKDRQYREAAEKESLELDNRLNSTDLFSRQLAIAKDMGATEEQLRMIRERFIFGPLSRLDSYQDQGLIGEVWLGSEQEERNKEE